MISHQFVHYHTYIIGRAPMPSTRGQLKGLIGVYTPSGRSCMGLLCATLVGVFCPRTFEGVDAILIASWILLAAACSRNMASARAGYTL
jgi:hypothetical protein